MPCVPGNYGIYDILKYLVGSSVTGNNLMSTEGRGQDPVTSMKSKCCYIVQEKKKYPEVTLSCHWHIISQWAISWCQ